MDLNQWTDELKVALINKGLLKQANMIKDVKKTLEVIGEFGATHKLDSIAPLKVKVDGVEKSVELGGDNFGKMITLGLLLSIVLNQR